MSRPSASTPCISYWVISPSELVARWSGMSSVSGSRLITTPAAWVRRVAGHALELAGEVDQLARPADRRRPCSRSGGRDLERLVELDAQLVGDGLGDPVDLAVAHAQDAPDVADGGPGEHRAEGDDLGDVVLAVLAADVGDDLVAPAVLEVDVDVGHRHPVRVEEALERQLVEDRVDRRDARACRSRSSPARCPGRSSGCPARGRTG